uniref:TPPP family protein n=1 Tax=Glossina brevipalpis TaxID=37001 RepID=A0A1A9WE33_9MUSC
MADDDDKPKRHTLQSLFHLYCNYIVIPSDLDNEVHDSIVLSQIDMWLEQAKLLKTVFSLTDTGLAYMKFRKWRLDFKEFQEFLELIVVGKELTVVDLKDMLIEAGVPGGAGEVVVVK